MANRFIRRQYAEREERGATIEARLLSPTGASCRTADGRRMEVDGAIADRQIYDLVYVAAFDVADDHDLAERTAASGLVRDWLRGQRADGAAIAASGAAILLLAEAGLLDGKPIAAPWWLEGALKHRLPHLDIDRRLTLSDHDGIFCDVGMKAAAALAIRLVERFLSPNVANWIAQLTMVERTEAETQSAPAFSPAILRHDPIVGPAQQWLRERFSEKPRMAELAAFLAISERTLTRRFERSLGMTPLAYLQALRIEVAKGMLARSNQKIERIAYLVSYSDLKFFKRVFRGLTGLSPSAYRRQAHIQAQATPEAPL